MCSRYEINANARELTERFALARVPPFEGAVEVRPTDRAPVIVPDAAAAAPAAVLMRFGLAVRGDAKPLINARAETLARRKTFRPLLGRRCVVPATAYFEWRRNEGRRLKMRIAPAAGGLFAFAGLTDGNAFAIVTRAPHPAIAHVHDRMPAILAAGDEGRWMDAELPFAAVMAVLGAGAGARLIAVEDVAAPAPRDLFQGG